MPINRMKAKNILITGGLGLLGSSMASYLKDQGHNIFIFDIKAVENIKKSKKIKFFEVDVSHEEHFNMAFSKITSKSQRIDALINCIYPKTPDWNTDVKNFSSHSFKENLATHLGGYFIPIRAFAEYSKKNNLKSSIVNISSVYGSLAPDSNLYKGTKKKLPCPYPSIKSGIHSLTTYFASYYGKFDIRVNTVSPGPVLNNQDNKIIKRYITKTPLQRLANPDDLNGLVEFLISERSSFITGQNVIVDGGLSII